MNTQAFSKNPLNNIPENKLTSLIKELNNSNLELNKIQLKTTAYMRYYNANIPIDYWNISMLKNFTGDSNLYNKYINYAENIDANYMHGKSICLAGVHGVGKTFVMSSILKNAVLKGYSGLYTTLYDIVSVLTKAPNNVQYVARKELLITDFLGIDEFDSRFFNSENSAELYAKMLEEIIRTRCQNKLPTILCTNSPNILNSLPNSLKESLGSLMSGYIETFFILGKDFRKNKV